MSLFQVWISVTRFGDISALWQQNLSLGPFVVGLFSLKQNFETDLDLFCYWINSQILKNVVTLVSLNFCRSVFLIEICFAFLLGMTETPESLFAS